MDVGVLRLTVISSSNFNPSSISNFAEIHYLHDCQISWSEYKVKLTCLALLDFVVNVADFS